MISIVMANSRARIPAYGGLDPIFGVNPISFGFPCDPEPVIVDFAVSRMVVSDIRQAITRGEQLPLGVALDSNGNETTDPKAALDGALLAIDGHKGNALALAVELLAGPLVRAKAGTAIKRARGYLFIVINPAVFGSISQFKEDVSSLVHEIKTSRRQPGCQELFFPGEQSARNRALARKQGVDVPDEILSVVWALTR